MTLQKQTLDKTVRYLLHFILGEEMDASLVDYIGYTNQQNTFHRYKVVIRPSAFFSEEIFGTPASLPQTPLHTIQDIPLLYGSAKEEWHGSTWVVSADIVASAFFLLSRYEEALCRKKRDKHGRFRAKDSILFGENTLLRPLVDEYRPLLHRWLKQAGVKMPAPKTGISHYYLTHDVDAPTYCRTWRNVLRCIKQGHSPQQALRWKRGLIEQDPFYTFPFLLEANQELAEKKANVSTLFFVKAGGTSTQDKPFYNLRSKDIRSLFALAADHQATIGLHSSYDAGATPTLIPSEKEQLEKALGTPITTNRHHFLRSRQPEDMEALERAGITDDFTLGFADHVGFRLGTARPVRRICPLSGKVGTLVLHPLTIMECSLSDPQYMNLAEEEAFARCQEVVSRVEEAGGELVLLWHNTSFAPVEMQTNCNFCHCELYRRLIQHLLDK